MTLVEKRTTQKRRKRFERAANPRNIVVTTRNLALLQHIYRYRFLTSHHLVALDGGNDRAVRRRLRDLYDHGVLDLPNGQRRALVAAARPNVFALGNRAKDLLGRSYDVESARIDWQHKNREHGAENLDHTLLVSDVMVGLRLACNARDDVALWDQEELLRMTPDAPRRDRSQLHLTTESTWRGDRFSVGVIPDRIFALNFRGEAHESPAFFMLEADRGHLTIRPRSARAFIARNSYQKKLLGYFEIWKRWKAWDGADDKRKPLEPKFGFRNFRLLTVTTSGERIETMIRAGREVTGGRGHRGFLFVDRKTLLSGDPFEVQWVNGRGETTRLKD